MEVPYSVVKPQPASDEIKDKQDAWHEEKSHAE
jgi:hypothetical protein